jgi:hypothetical protein
MGFTQAQGQAQGENYHKCLGQGRHKILPFFRNAKNFKFYFSQKKNQN